LENTTLILGGMGIWKYIREFFASKALLDNYFKLILKNACYGRKGDKVQVYDKI